MFMPGMSLYGSSGLVDLLWLGAALLISVCVLTKSYLVVVFYFVLSQVV